MPSLRTSREVAVAVAQRIWEKVTRLLDALQDSLSFFLLTS